MSQPAPVPVPDGNVRAAASLSPPGGSAPAFWQKPNLYGYPAVLLGIAAFPLVNVLSSELAGISLAVLGIGFGLAGLVMWLLFRQRGPTAALVGLAIGAAMLFGLLGDVNRKELAQKATTVAENLAESEKTLKTIQEEKANLEELKKEPEKLRNEAKEKEDQAREEYKKAKEALDKGVEEKKDAEKARQEALGKLEEAKKKEKDLETKQKDADKKIEELKQMEKQFGKIKKGTEEAQKEFQKEKDTLAKQMEKVKEEAAKEIEKAKEMLEKAKEERQKAEEALKMLMAKVKSATGDQRVKAMKSLGTLGLSAPPMVVRAICEVALDPNENVKKEARFALQKVRPQLFVPVVMLLSIQYNQPGLDPTVFSHVKRLEEKPSESEPTIPIFLGQLQKFLDVKNPTEADLETAKLFISATGKIGQTDSAALDLLGKVAGYKLTPSKDGEEEVRQSARTALFQIGTAKTEVRKQIIPHLSAGLNEKKAELRKQACEWLGAYGPDAKTAIGELMKLTSDTEAAVKDAAEKALKQIQK